MSSSADMGSIERNSEAGAMDRQMGAIITIVRAMASLKWPRPLFDLLLACTLFPPSEWR